MLVLDRICIIFGFFTELRLLAAGPVLNV